MLNILSPEQNLYETPSISVRTDKTSHHSTNASTHGLIST
jgi:hypothetical protein